MQKTSGFYLAIMSTIPWLFFVIPWMFHCMMFVLEMLKSWICGGRLLGFWFYIYWSFISLIFSLFFRLQLAVGRAGSFSFCLFLQYSIRGRRPVQAVSRLRTTRISDWLSSFALVGVFDVVRLKVFFTAFVKINSGCGFILRSFRMDCCLGMRSFVWIWTIFVSHMNIGQFLENAWLLSPQWQHRTSVLVHLSLLCPWQLHFAHFAIVSWHLFTVCPYLRHVLQLIGLSKYSKVLVFACSPGISMNLGVFFLWKSVGVEYKQCFWFISMLLSSRLGGCTLSLVRCHSLQYPVCYNRGCRSGLGFGWFCRMRIFQLLPFLWIVENIVML